MKKIWNWITHRLKHKLEHVKLTRLIDTLKEHGLALVIIIVGWEIIEDVLFPLLFIWMGKHIHPVFYGGAPAAWLLCLHWLAVPLICGLWIKITQKNIDTD